MSDIELHLSHMVILVVLAMTVLVIRANHRRLKHICEVVERIELQSGESKKLAEDNAKKVWKLLQALGREPADFKGEIHGPRT